ncbi:MAG: ABC transporter substrate-binding protein [Pseudobutyrivibrio ruminis]|nr:ABC transporter substrate-binding protein [Pseudobutyrivibrio ruminis]
MKKKILSLLLVATLAIGVTACGQSASSNDASSEGKASESADGYLKDTVTVALSADGGTFDPYGSFVNWGQASMLELVYQGLVSTDYDYNVYYQVAKRIEQVDDYTWEVEIWDSVKDTNGNQITMDDVIWCYDQVIASGNAGAIPKFDHWEKIDDYTGQMILSEPFGAGDYEKHFSNAKILSQATYEELGDMTQNPVGSGPYMLDSYVVNSEVVLTVNPDFWMDGVVDYENPDSEYYNPMIIKTAKTFKYEIIQDASSRAIALETGSVDIVDAMDASDVANLSTNDDINVVNLPQRPPVTIVMNANSESVLSNQSLRQAICYALDNEAIGDAIGLPYSVAYGFQPNMVDSPESWSTGEGRDYYNYDVDKAASLLSEAGYNGETLTLLYVSSTANDAASIMIQSQLRAAGINVELLNVDQTIAQQYKYEPDKWDIRLEIVGGGAYLAQTTKGWWSEDIIDFLTDDLKGCNTSLVVDEELDNLYVALKDDNSDENIAAWDEYFNEKAYAYSICSYSTQTCTAGDIELFDLATNGGLLTNCFKLTE